MSIPAPEGRQQWVLNLTDNQALQKAGVFSKSYWPKHFEKNFGYLLSTLETKLFGIVQARGAGGRVKPGVEPKAEPQVRFGAPSRNGRQPLAVAHFVGSDRFAAALLGLTPQALCCRLLRRLKATVLKHKISSNLVYRVLSTPLTKYLATSASVFDNYGACCMPAAVSRKILTDGRRLTTADRTGCSERLEMDCACSSRSERRNRVPGFAREAEARLNSIREIRRSQENRTLSSKVVKVKNHEGI